jgi:D-alanyl-D-alanine carboxypeptidase
MAPPLAPRHPAQSPDFAAAARDIIARYVAGDLFAGTVLVAAGDTLLLHQGFGLADRELHVSHGTASKFRTGSLTKQFTAAAILQLMEQGRLALDDLLTKHDPEAPEHWREVRLVHLLTHSSGIPSYTSLPGFFERDADRERTPQEIIALTRDAPLHFPPGSAFKYNNGGYVILGHILERLTGMSYEAYLKRNILRPLGLDDTGYEKTGDALPFRARGYRLANGHFENAAFLAMSLPYAAGSVYSTARDLFAWLRALKAGKPICSASVALMLRDHGHGYGMGFGIQKQFSQPHLVHAGGINGFSVVMSHYPDDDLTILALANIQAAPVQKLACDLAALYFGVEDDKEISLDPALLADYVGTYRLGKDKVLDKILRVTQEGARLFVEWEGRKTLEAIAQDDHSFKVEPAGWSLSFEADGVSLASKASLTDTGGSWSGPRIEETPIEEA